MLLLLLACRPDATVDAAPSQCDDVPSFGWESSEILGVHRSHGFTINGPHLISTRRVEDSDSSEDEILRAASPAGPSVPWVSTFGNVTSIRHLSDGDLVFLERFVPSLYQLTPAGEVTRIAGDVGSDGEIAVGDSDLVYIVDPIGVHVVDPRSPFGSTAFVEEPPWGQCSGVAVSSDRQQLYVASEDKIWSVPLDSAGLPSGSPALWATLPDDVQYASALAADACGNLFVAMRWLSAGAGLHWFPADGGPSEVVIYEEGSLTFTDLQWGSGEGAWDEETLYISARGLGDLFFAVDVGVGSSRSDPQ